MEENQNQIKIEDLQKQIKGKQSIEFLMPPHIKTGISVVGKKEGEGPLKEYFDVIAQDPMFGGDNWEDAESRLQKEAIHAILHKSALQKADIRYLFAGDLLGQSIATTFGVVDFDIPLFGLFGACSTIGEAMSLGAMTVSGGFAENVITLASSHYASAEKDFRFPLPYGNQRAYSATWTVTGCGAVIICPNGGIAKITKITTGKVVDYGVKDNTNMGACMAPAAADVIYQHFVDFGIDNQAYDRIITGDLGYIGQTLLIDLLKDKGYDITDQHMDCGIEIFDSYEQDTHAGGSGCGCAAATFCSYILRMVENGGWKKILFIPTGALMSRVSFNEGNSVPGIAHCLAIETNKSE